MSGISYAKIIKDDVYLVGQKEYDLKTVCDFFYKQDFPLIEIKSATQLDCMKGQVSVGTFCAQKQSDDPHLIRGFIDSKNNKVICQSAKRVILKYSCSNKDPKHCEDSSIGCYILKEKLAMRLKVVHHSITTDTPGKKSLNCYYESKNSEALDK